MPYKFVRCMGSVLLLCFVISLRPRSSRRPLYVPAVAVVVTPFVVILLVVIVVVIIRGQYIAAGAAYQRNTSIRNEFSRAR